MCGILVLYMGRDEVAVLQFCTLRWLLLWHMSIILFESSLKSFEMLYKVTIFV